MINLVHDLITASADRFPDRTALKYHGDAFSYVALNKAVNAFSAGLINIGLKRCDRVAIYAEKRFETVIGMFGSVRAGGVYVPVNPLLKADQVAYILNDCDVHALITTSERMESLIPILSHCPNLKYIIYTGVLPTINIPKTITLVDWNSMQQDRAPNGHRVIDQDMAAILYTSGSTGNPKGVVLSHRNIIAGATSVAEYLELTHEDRVLCVLPLSFDYGMNQLTTMFYAGGMAVLMNHLFPKDIVTLVAKERITGLAAVPPLWIQLAGLPWGTSIDEHLRYFTNSGGHMPKETLTQLRNALPKTKPFLMYGLTESFRSTYLPPDQIDIRPDSMGRAIPNAEIFVVKPDGSPCAPDEPGELVHRGVHVSLGYWNDPEKTVARFKPMPNQNRALPLTEMTVWSGDIVRQDAEGYLYFVSRNDEMIKTSGYRVSPTEIEEMVYNTRLAKEAAAFGIPHPVLGQVIALIATPSEEGTLTSAILKAECQKRLPNYMVPTHIEILSGSLPRNSNGKIDRKFLSTQRQDLFKGISHE